MRGTGVESLATPTNPLYNRECFEAAHDLIINTWTTPGPCRWEGEPDQFRDVNPFAVPLECGACCQQVIPGSESGVIGNCGRMPQMEKPGAFVKAALQFLPKREEGNLVADNTLIYVGAEAYGLYRKEVGEKQWEALSNGLPPSPQVRPIAIHPENPAVMFVGTQRGVYRTQDRGDHWQRMNLPEGRVVWSLQFHPHKPQVMYLGTEGSEVYSSQDGGENWTYLSTITNPDAVQMAFSTRILGFAMERDKPEQMFAALEVGGAARSHNGGKTWQMVNRDLAGSVDLLDLHGVAVGAADSSAVFIANRVGVWRSRDRGDTWENMHLERFSPIVYSRGVQTAPGDPNTLYACVGLNFGSETGGVMRTTDLGETWERIDHGMPPRSTTFGVATNRQHPEQLSFCTRRGQVFSTPDGGASWQEHVLPDIATQVISVACASA